MTDFNEDNFRNLCKDVKEIKGALIGSDTFGQKGLIKRTEDLETDVQALFRFKTKVIYYVAGAAGGGASIIQVLFNVLG